VFISGYNYGIHDSSGGAWSGGAHTGFIRDVIIDANERGIVLHSSGWMIQDFYIQTCAKEGILIESPRVGTRIENNQILDGECYNCGYGGLVLRQLEHDLNKNGRYSTANYEDGVIPSETTKYGEGWLGDWGETTTNKDWDYGETVSGEWTDPWGVTGVSRPTVPMVFNTRISNVACGTNQGANTAPYYLTALRECGTSITYDGTTSTTWCELEFEPTSNSISTTQGSKDFYRGYRLGDTFPVGKGQYAQHQGYHIQMPDNGNESVVAGSSFGICIASTGTHKIVISKEFSSIAPTGYVSGEALSSDSYMVALTDVVFGKGVREAAINHSRFNWTYFGGCAHFRFTDNRLKSGFWMADTCEGITFFGSRQAIFGSAYIDNTESWGTYDTDDDGIEVYTGWAGSSSWGDRLLKGPGASSGWCSVEMTTTTNDPSLDIKPELKMEMPKEGTTTQFDGEPLEFSGVVVSPTGVEIQGQLDKGTERTLDDDEELQDVGSGTYWITPTHTQAPTVVDDETFWLVENHRAAGSGFRYPIVRGWKTAGYTTTVYGGVIDGDGVTVWGRLDHDA
jgi:hypothetical protein